jgi:AcrR family transcriptional regulator
MYDVATEKDGRRSRRRTSPPPPTDARRAVEHLAALEVWTRAQPGSRRPRYSREQIAAAAVEVADAEGFDAVSMRRIATELGAGTMTLYHYVHNKDELLALVADSLIGEVVVPAAEAAAPVDWKEAITGIARRTRDMLRRHPWVLDITDSPAVGPNFVRHFDQSMQALSRLDAPLADRLDVIMTVDEYVFGFCLHERSRFREPAPDEDEGLVDYVTGLLATGDYPTISAMVDEVGLRDLWAQIHAHAAGDERFDRNLARLLAGLEADVGRAPAASADDRPARPSGDEPKRAPAGRGRARPR